MVDIRLPSSVGYLYQRKSKPSRALHNENSKCPCHIFSSQYFYINYNRWIAFELCGLDHVLVVQMLCGSNQHLALVIAVFVPSF